MTRRSRPESLQKMWREMHHSSCHHPRFGGGGHDLGHGGRPDDDAFVPMWDLLQPVHRAPEKKLPDPKSICSIVKVTEELYENELSHTNETSLVYRHCTAVRSMFPVSFSTQQLFFSLSSVRVKSTTSGRVTDWH